MLGSNELPECVPTGIRQDYREARAIVTLSPKAAATLARRCMQAMIRDFWRISKATLHKELSDLQDQIDHDTWEAIDALRKVGNIGAHGDVDPSVIVEVEPGEAEALLELVDVCAQDWYVRRERRQAALTAAKELAVQKDRQRILAREMARDPHTRPSLIARVYNWIPPPGQVTEGAEE